MATTVHENKRVSSMIDYQKLPSGSIRMMLLNAGDSEEPLRAQLETVRLDSMGDNFIFNALSYTWSDEERDHPMFLDDKPIMVTKQLGELFHEHRKDILKDWCSRWWIDQICINQDDDEDKAQQVPHMGMIYERANYVTIWLRPGLSEDSQSLIDLVRRLINLSRQPGTGNGLDCVPVSTILGPPTEETFRSWRALKSLMNHRYWTRTWILPEACACVDRSTVVCGTLNQVIELRHMFLLRMILAKLVPRWEECPPEYPLDDISSSLVGRVDNFNIYRTSKTKRVVLFDLLFVTRRTECSIPEDKIFAVLPSADDVGDYANDKYIKPLYALGCERVYSDLIKWYVMQYRNLDFLGYCAATTDEIAQIPGFDLPSWIPNWTHASNMRPLFKYRNPLALTEDRARVYNACGPYSGSVDIVETPTAQHGTATLFCSGIRIATVHKVLDSVPQESRWDPGIEISWHDEFDASAEYPMTKESYHDAYERTVVVDAFHHVDDTVSRPGRVVWWHNNPELSPFDRVEREFQVKAATSERALFFARSGPTKSDDNNEHEISHVSETNSTRLGADCSSFLMGLGRRDVAVGDEIWALKGGQVLYVLRKKYDSIMFCNSVESPEPGWTSCPSVLWMDGQSHPWSATLTGTGFSFIGECYVHGLMDGEALEYALLQPEQRPEVLQDMSSDFEEIFIGGVMKDVF